MALLLSFGEFELDEARFELRRSGEPVAVQPKVLELLLHLARHRDRVVSKDELFETVWDGTTVTEASLTQAVSLARKALGESAREPRAIRTVRGRGLQFVASAPPTPPPPRMPVELGSTDLETMEEVPPRTTDQQHPILFVVVHGDAPGEGGACWSLADVDEVQIGRASTRRSQRTGKITRVLHLGIPGRRLSREHARLARSPDGWMAIDANSRNGTYVNGKRITRKALRVGDYVRCGHTIFQLGEAHVAGGNADARDRPDSLLATVTPPLIALEDELSRIAVTDIPVLLGGESGTGKTELAERLHACSRRGARGVLHGPSLPVDDPQTITAAIEEVKAGTVILEGLERLPTALVPTLIHALDGSDARLIATTQIPLEELDATLPLELLSRLDGYRGELPPLRERLGDFGTLVARVLEAPPRLEPDAVDALLAHDWPGNLRELGLVLRSSAVGAGADRLRLEHLPATFHRQAAPSLDDG